MPIAAAVGVAGVAGAAISSSAAKSAAKTQATAAQKATDTQLQMYGQTREDLAPYRAVGSTFLPGLQRLLGVDSAGNAINVKPQPGDKNYALWADQNPDIRKYYDQTPEAQAAYPNFLDFAKSISGQQSNVRIPVPTYSAQDVAAMPTAQEQALEAIPGFQFARDQGVNSIQRVMGSMGQTGPQAKGIARFVTGLAQQNYGDYYNRFLQGAQLGANAAAQTGQIGANYSGNIANTIVGQGTATAAGTVGAANAITGGLSSIPSALILSKVLGGGGTGSGGGSGGQYQGTPGYIGD